MNIRLLTPAALLSLCAAGLCVVACTQPRSEESRAMDLAMSSDQVVAEVHDYRSAQEAAVKLGYLASDRCADGLRGGEEVMFSTGGDAGNGEDETGQASGLLVKVGEQLFFEQRAEHRRGSSAFAPGLSRALIPGVHILTTWEFRTLRSALCQMAFNFDSDLEKPLYSKANASIGNVTGSAAGLKIAHENVMKITLHRKVDERGSAIFKLYLKKGVGPVAYEVFEHDDYLPGRQAEAPMNQHTSFRLYIGAPGGTGIGDGPTISDAERERESLRQALETRRQEECKTIGGSWERQQCMIDKPQYKTFEECATSGATWYQDLSGNARCRTSHYFRF